jgi:hypothetical protein
MQDTTESRTESRHVVARCTMALTTFLLGGSLLAACSDDYPAKDVAQDSDQAKDSDDAEDTTPARDAGRWDTGGDAGRRDAGPRFTCPSAPTLGECGMCANDSCCQERGTLENDGAPLYDCFQACASGNKTCQTSCLDRYPALVPYFRALGQCLNSYCEVECGE